MSPSPPKAAPSAPAADSTTPADGHQQQQQQQQQQPRQQQQQRQQQSTAARRLPVTLLSGFLGAGKTTLLRHLLRHAGPLRIAVVVNDVAALNIDASLLKGGGLIQSQEQLVELQNGCICCSLRVDLVAAVAALAAKGAFDLLLLESTGVSEPMQVAELFDVDVPIADILNSGSNDGSNDAPAAAAAAAAAVSAAAGGGDSAAAAVLLRDVSYLDTAVTVVDAHHMLANLHSIHTFRDLSAVGSSQTPAAETAAAAAAAAAASDSSPAAVAAAAAAPEAVLSGSHRHIAELLLEQIEVADVLLLNKADTVSEQELQLLQAMLCALNPSAKLLTTSHSVVQPSEVLLTGLWEAHKAQGGAAWVQLMRHDTPQQAADPQQQQQQQQQQGGHAHDGPCSHRHQHSSSDTAAAAVGVGGSGSCSCCPAAAPSSGPPPGASSSSNNSSTAAAGGGALVGGAAAAAARPTSSYGASHFVYRARLPFHPGRLHNFMVKFFILQEPDWSRMLGGAGAGTDGDDSSSASESESESEEPAAKTAAGEKDGTSRNGVQQQQQQASVQVLQAVAGERRAACEGAFGVLLRSKGFVWLATRGDHIGEWSQAGSLLSFSTGGPWFCVQPPQAWPGGQEERSAILADFAPAVGDRRQELVFIGVGLREGALRDALDGCLVTVGEMEAGFRGLPDPFEPWPDVGDMMDLDEPSEGEEAVEEDEQQQQAAGVQAKPAPATQQGAAAAGAAGAAAEGDAACWQPGQVVTLCEGAPQLQELLDSIEATLTDPTALSQLAAAAAAAAAGGGGGGGPSASVGPVQQQAPSAAAAAAAPPPPLVLIEWVAPWAAASLTASQQLTALAAICPCLPVLRVDVAGSFPNQALALEKVMEVPQVYRKGGRKFQPVPKSGAKWPCVTLHLAPSLQPQQEFSGPHTLDNLLQALLQRGCITQAAADAATAAAAAAHTPAAVAATAAAASAAACRGPLRPPFRTAAGGLEHDSDGQQQLDDAAAAAAAAVDGPRQGLLPASQCHQQRQFKLVKRGAADLKQLLQQVAPTQLLLLAWSPAQSSSAAAAAAAAGDQPDAGSDSSVAGVIDSTDAVESLAAALVAAAAAANSASLVVVAVADAGASTANQALAAALSVQQPVVQLYHNRQVVKAVKVGGLGVAAAVGKVQKAVLQVLQQAREQAQQQPKQQQQKAVGSGPATAAAAAGAGAAKAATAPAQDSSSSTAASTGTAAGAAGGGSSGGATRSSSDATTTTSTTSSSSSSMWDPPAPKAGKPVKAGAKLSFPASAVFGATSSSTVSSTVSSTIGSTVSNRAGSTVKVVYWPRMPCLSCGCPYWLGEDWDASCARCGWSCEEGGYDDDSNPMPQHAQRYKDIVAELKAGRTPSGLQPLQE